MDDIKHDWQNGKLLPEDKRMEIFNLASKKPIQTELIWGVSLIVVTVVMVIIGALLAFRENPTSFQLGMGELLLGISIMPLVAAPFILYDYFKHNNLKKMLETGDFVFAEEEIKSLHNHMINGTQTIFESALETTISSGLRLTNKVILIRKSMQEKDTVYGFLISNQDHSQERIAAIEWKTPDQLKNLKAYQETAPDKFFKEFLWCEATVEGIHKMDRRVGYGKQARTVTEIKYIYARGLSCIATSSYYGIGDTVLLYRNPKVPDEVLAYYFK